MRFQISISVADAVHVNMRTWARPIAAGEFGDMVPTPTVFIHVGGRTLGSERLDDGHGPRVMMEHGTVDIDLARAVELRDQLTAVIAEYEQAQAGGEVAATERTSA